ncbi:MAG TPA: trehalase-like domain-containing protein, partial [Asanoa sp.]|nr:trehalase-like domain-containing protein [Asanoa sp.]
MTTNPDSAEAAAAISGAGGLVAAGGRNVRAASGWESLGAARSPFPPIEDYAFLSNCHTGALIAPDGSVDWLCVPRFDSPSIFGAVLDREAGMFRLGPYGINHSTARDYEPGTNVLLTTWRTQTGWVLVRDALSIGPANGPDVVTPHSRPPYDDDADHLFVRTVECLDGHVDVELVCEPAFDYGRTPATWSFVDNDRRVADGSGAGTTVRLRSDMAMGIEGNRIRGRRR